jgi:protein-L-isoaspartate(D-aspartate) O-methyltransferase
LGAEVFTIETQKVLHAKASRFLTEMGYKANFFLGDGTVGLKKFAPFDKIIVTAGAPQVPDAYLDQMKIGGLLVIPVGDDVKQVMHRIKKISDHEFSKENFGDFKFVKLLGQDGW